MCQYSHQLGLDSDTALNLHTHSNQHTISILLYLHSFRPRLLHETRQLNDTTIKSCLLHLQHLNVTATDRDENFTDWLLTTTRPTTNVV